VRYLEFRSAWQTNVLDLDDAQLDRVGKTLAAHGLRVSSIGSPIGKIGVADDFAEHLRRFDARCTSRRCWGALPAAVLVLPAGRGRPGDPPDECCAGWRRWPSAPPGTLLGTLLGTR